MNSLKTLVIMAVLGGVAYGLYVSLKKNPESPPVADNQAGWPDGSLTELPAPGADGALTPPTVSLSGATVADGNPYATDPPVAPQFAPTAPPYGAPGANPLAAPGETALSPYPSGLDASPFGAVVPASTLGATDLAPSREPAADSKFSIFLQAIQTKLDDGHLAEAHLALSSLYGSPDVPPEHVQEVTDLLDQLAGTVIYSRQHLLEAPYRVRTGETLEQVAAACDVPWQLLARINGIRDPQRLDPGRELKVVRGPFNALVNLGRYELTLMVDGRYAGRFPIGVGRDHTRLEGTYTVRAKVPNPPYSGSDVAYAPDDPANPLGELLIDLGSQVGIHGTNDPQNLHQTGGRGSICLGERDIVDVYGILSIGSRVVVRR